MKVKEIMRSVDKNGDTPLFLACMQGAPLKDVMAGEYAENDHEAPDEDEKALIERNKKRRLETVKLLLENGAKPIYTKGQRRMTPLHWACYHGDAELVRLLIEYRKANWEKIKERLV